MKRQNIFKSILLATVALLFLVNNSKADFEAVPVQRSPQYQSGKYQTDLFTGSASYTYSLNIPKGTNNLTPNVTLSYNSSAAHEASMLVGAGWELVRDYVQRDANNTPGNTSDDKYKLHFKGGTYDLIYNSSDNLYHTKIESYLKIQQLTSGGQGSTATYWQVTTTDGTLYRFGYNTNSELMCNGRSYESYWNLDQVQDTHNNHIYYTYTQSSGVAYLSQVKYNNDQQREIDFSYVSNPYQHQIYSQGCNISEVNRLSNIQIKVGTALVRQYDLAYLNAGNNQQSLHSITEKGSNGTSSLPPTTFDYKSEIKNWNNTYVKWLDHQDIDAPTNSTNTDLIDVTGDGLPDLVKSEGNGSNTWKVWRNNGTGFNTTAELWINNAGVDAKLEMSDVRLIDVTGDSLPDIVKASNSSSWKILRNTGSSWNTNWEQWANLSSYTGAHLGNNATLGNDTALLVDVTGDGLPDIVNTWWNAHMEYRVFRNTGSGWSGSPEIWSNNGADLGLDSNAIRILDANGDGLPDIIKTTHNGTNATWYVYKNTGTNWNTSAETWINNANVDAYFENKNIALTDVNGDSLPDIVKSDDLGTADRWNVLLNQGNNWSTSYEIWIDPSANVDVDVHNDNTLLADINGDGLSDIVKGQMDCSCGFDTYYVWKNNGVSPDVLAKVTTSQGGAITFDYTPSTSFTNTSLPFPMWLVTKMTVNNGMNNSQATNDITSYSYRNGYYKWQDKDFRGFGEVNETQPNTAKKQSLFNQGDDLKGMITQTTTTDAQNNPYIKTENTWTSSQSNGVFTNKLSTIKNYTYDGTANNPKITQTDYQYDSYGNTTKQSDLGDISNIGDEKYTYYEYTYNPSLWLVNTVKDTYVKDPDDATKVSETWSYYDNNLGLSDAPSKGDLTKEVKWLNGGSNPTTTYQYDNYGNQVAITDTNNHTTQTAFGTNDTTYTYPDSQTNAKNQQTTYSYDLGTGNLLSKTDPNGFTTAYTYDVFGRITAEIEPYDTLSYPTTVYQYFDNTTAPQGSLISKRKISAAPGTLDMYTFTDGLGRKIQTRTDAQNSSNQIVTNIYYEATGQVAKQSVQYLDTKTTAYQSPVSGIGNITSTYDPIGRMITLTNPDNTIRTSSYNHWIVTDTDENGHQKKQYYNADNQIIQVDEINGPNTYTTTYTYDPLDNLTKITDAANNNLTMTYDTLSRKNSQTDPDMGVWMYEYDGKDNLTKTTDNRGVIKNITYDELDRVTKNTFPNDADITYTYDGNNKIGTLTSVADSGGTVSYNYDNRLRKTQEQRTMDGNTWTTQYEYDAADRIISQTNPDGETVTYGFNAQGEIASVSGILTNMEYNAQNKITAKTFANGLTTNYTYNTDNFRLNNIQTGTSQDLSYTYDNVGNVATVKDNLTNKTQTFGYDDLDRLTSAQENGGYNYTYAYNPIGNLTQFIKDGTEIDYTYGQNAGVHALTTSSEQSNTPTATPTPTPAQNNSYTIYDEGLENNWEDWSWGSTDNLSDTTHPNTGSLDFAWTANSGYAGVNLHKVNGVDTTPYTTVTFALRASQANQHVQVQFHDASDVAIGNPVPLNNYGGDPSVGSYTTYNIPLSALGGSNRVITGLIIQDITGTAQPVMYIDTIKLTGNTVSPTATPTSTNTPTPTQSNNTTSIYDETLASGWQDWSWSATNNFNDTTYPYSGSKDLAWTNNAGYGALYLHSSGFNTNNYNAITFALRSTQANQSVQIQAYDASDNAIGTPVPVANYGGDPVTGSYKVYTIPFADLGGSNQILHGFILQDMSGTAQPAMYIDSVALVSNASNSFTGEYFTNKTLSGTPTLTRQDNIIDFDWGGGSPDAAIPDDNFSARWTKTTNFAAGTYQFSVTADDGIRLYIDNSLVIDEWIDQGATTYTATRTLSAGNHTIKVEYYENGGGALAQFSYQQLTGGYAAEYYDNQNLNGTPVLTRTDADIDFDWGGNAPDASLPADHFSARWTKAIDFSAGTYKFQVTADDGIRVYVDNNLLIDQWIDQGATTYSASQSLSAGTHMIKIEYYENSGGALAQFSYQPTNDLALNKTAVASSLEAPESPASYAVDGNSATRWSSGYSDPQWIYVDLGSTYTINQVRLNWEAAYATAYEIQVSNDSNNWTTIYSTTSGQGGVENLTNLNGTGRYVRVYGTQRAIAAGYSLWDIEVYGN